FRVLMIYLKPVLPDMAKNSEAFLNDELAWPATIEPLLGHRINSFKPLMQRVDKDKVDAMLDASRSALPDESSTPDKPATGHLAESPLADEIAFDDFIKVDLRVARIVKAEAVEGAEKLLQLTLD